MPGEPAPVFDAEWYLWRNPDVAESGMDPLQHYINHGATERRDPHPLFSTKWYLSEYPDVAVARVDPFRHYLTHGASGGARPAPAL